jgi:hypothetical protein
MPALMTLEQLVTDFANGLKSADARYPVAANTRTKEHFQPGIGPHTEVQAVSLVMHELRAGLGSRYVNFSLGVPYPENPRQKCDLCLGVAPMWDRAVEVKMLRLMGDNGKLNDNMLMHILSPYPEHRSALTDCVKLAYSSLSGQKTVLIYAFDQKAFPVEVTLHAFELLARDRVRLGTRAEAHFEGLVHPVHSRGIVAAWDIYAGSEQNNATLIGTQC